MESLKNMNTLEYLLHGFTSSTVRFYVTWSFCGAKKLARKYNDLVFWYATYIMTAYPYKLFTFTIVYCESKVELYSTILGYLRMPENVLEFCMNGVRLLK